MPDLRCKRIFATLSEFLDAELPARTCRELERHLAGCKPCVAYLETLKTTTEACQRYGEVTAPAPPAALISTLRDRIVKARSKSKRGKRRTQRG
jgi:anti-sigma factor RsiW